MDTDKRLKIMESIRGEKILKLTAFIGVISGNQFHIIYGRGIFFVRK